MYLKFQPYVHMSVAHRSCQKLGFRYFGPYSILECVGAVAYRLDLPAGSQVHPVVHVSLLKKAVKPDVVVCQDIPQNYFLEDVAVQPEAIQQRHLVKCGSSVVPYGLIRWTGMPDELATWENLRQLKTCFPSALAWGQAKT